MDRAAAPVGASPPSAAVAVPTAAPADAHAVTAIYNEGIRGRGATFETAERTADDVLAWFAPAGDAGDAPPPAAERAEPEPVAAGA